MKTQVKIYNWQQLTKLILDDLKRQGTPVTGRFHVMGGSDVKGHPYLRIDLTPVPKPDTKGA